MEKKEKEEKKDKVEKKEERALRRLRGKGVESGRKQEKVRKYIKKKWISKILQDYFITWVIFGENKEIITDHSIQFLSICSNIRKSRADKILISQKVQADSTYLKLFDTGETTSAVNVRVSF